MSTDPTPRLRDALLEPAVRSAVAHDTAAIDAPVTLSAGISTLRSTRDAETLRNLADGALYWASTLRHSERVSALAVRVAVELGWEPARLRRLRDAALLHDDGKLATPDAVLFKPGRLDPGEYEQVQAHCELGAQIVRDLLDPEQVSWVRGHHERPDGRGYPDGLTAEAIPDGAAILAVADAFDAMTAARPYSAPLPPAEALDECVRLAGAQFDPGAVAALAAVLALPVDGRYASRWGPSGS